MAEGHLIIDNYDDCTKLHEQGARMTRPMGNFKTMVNATNDIVDGKTACSVLPNAPECKRTTTTSEKYAYVAKMMVQAQLNGTRSLEVARQKNMERNTRFNRAQCNRRAEEVTTHK